MSRTRHPSIRLRTRLPKKLCNIIYHFDTFTERDTKQNLEKKNGGGSAKTVFGVICVMSPGFQFKNYKYKYIMN